MPSILDSLVYNVRAAATRIAYKANSPAISALMSALQRTNEYAYPDLSKFESQMDAFRRSATVYMCVDAIASAAADVKLNVVRIQGDDREQIVNHPLELLLNRPSRIFSQYEFMYATTLYLLTTGNAYWSTDSESGAPEELIMLRPDRVTINPGTTADHWINTYTYDAGGSRVKIDADQVSHFKTLDPTNDLYGMSILESIAPNVQSDIAMSQWNRHFFDQESAVPTGIVSIKSSIADTDYDRLQSEWRKSYGGTSRRTAFLRGADIEFQPIGLSHRDMDFTVGRTTEQEIIMKAFRVPPGMFDKNATQANAQASLEVFIRHAVWPRMVQIAQTITNTIAKRYGDDLIVEPEDIRIKDAAAERDEIRAVMPIMTINEIRQKYFDMPPLPEGGDKLAATSAPGMPPPMPASASPVPPTPPPEPEANMNAAKAIADTPDPISVPRVSQTDALQKQYRQFAKFVQNRIEGGQDLEVNRFRFLGVPLAVDIAAKSYSVTITDLHELSVFVKADREARPRTSMSGVPDPAADAKQKGEDQLYEAFTGFFEKTKARAITAVRQASAVARKASLVGNLSAYAEFFDRQFWALVTADLDSAVRGEIQALLEAGTIDATNRLKMLTGISIDPSTFGPRAASWARLYTDDVLKKFGTTTKDGVGALLERWVGTEGATVADLVGAIQESHLFSKERAALVATTEITRTFAQAEVIAGQELAKAARVPFRDAASADIVPPLHPNCRCFLATEAVFDADDRLVAFDTIFHTSADPFVCLLCNPLNGKKLSEAA